VNPPDDLVHLQLTNLAGAIRQAEGPLPTGIRLRTADPATDLPLIAELYNAAFGPADPAKATPEEVARLAQHPGLDPGGVFLAFDGDLAVGLGVASVEVSTAWQTAHRGAIELLAVRPAYRRQGIGRALIGAVLAWLADQGVVTVGASAEDPVVIALLQRHGFREELPSPQPRPPAGQSGLR
jgi:ribosomal protein S18 acetylase RimI-like enzyme